MNCLVKILVGNTPTGNKALTSAERQNRMNNDQVQPIFIMSSERSGSNLLRTLLSNHRSISAPTAPHFLLFLHKLIPYYGSLSIESNARSLFEDMLSIANHTNYQWGLSIDFEQIYQKYQPDAFMDFFNLFYQEETCRNSKSRFVCKENNIFDFVFPIVDYYKSAKFIYLYRDPRDYVASYLSAPLGISTPFDAARRWRNEQEKCNVLINTFCLEAHYVKYEDLISDPSEVMTSVLSFVDAPIDERCFEVQVGKNENLTWNSYWQNLDRPIIKSNTKKYLETFDARTINIIESVVKDQMLRLGYELDTSADWNCTILFRIRNRLSRRISKFWSRMRDPETSEVMISRKELIASIRHKRREKWRQERLRL